MKKDDALKLEAFITRQIARSTRPDTIEAGIGADSAYYHSLDETDTVQSITEEILPFASERGFWIEFSLSGKLLSRYGLRGLPDQDKAEKKEKRKDAKKVDMIAATALAGTVEKLVENITKLVGVTVGSNAMIVASTGALLRSQADIVDDMTSREITTNAIRDQAVASLASNGQYSNNQFGEGDSRTSDKGMRFLGMGVEAAVKGYLAHREAKEKKEEAKEDVSDSKTHSESIPKKQTSAEVIREVFLSLSSDIQEEVLDSMSPEDSKYLSRIVYRGSNEVDIERLKKLFESLSGEIQEKILSSAGVGGAMKLKDVLFADEVLQ